MRKSKNEVLKYLGWYMDKLTISFVLFGLYSSNSFILMNKIIMLNYLNKLDRSEIESVYLSSKLVYFESMGFTMKQLIGLENIQTENLN